MGLISGTTYVSPIDFKRTRGRPAGSPGLGQLVLEPDHDYTTEVNASSAATVAAMTAMSIAVMAMMIIVSIVTCSTSIGRPIRRVTVRVLSTPPSIRVFGRDKTGNQQSNSQYRNELENLHKSPLSVG